MRFAQPLNPPFFTARESRMSTDDRLVFFLIKHVNWLRNNLLGEGYNRVRLCIAENVGFWGSLF